MRTMGVCKKEKLINIDYCCLCQKAEVDRRVICSMKKSPSDSCVHFIKAEDVSARMDELFSKLPDNYGFDEHLL